MEMMATTGMGAPLLLYHITRIPMHHITRAPVHAIGEDCSCWVIRLSFHPRVLNPVILSGAKKSGSSDETLRCPRVTIK